MTKEQIKEIRETLDAAQRELRELYSDDYILENSELLKKIDNAHDLLIECNKKPENT